MFTATRLALPLGRLLPKTVSPWSMSEEVRKQGRPATPPSCAPHGRIKTAPRSGKLARRHFLRLGSHCVLLGNILPQDTVCDLFAKGRSIAASIWTVV